MQAEIVSIGTELLLGEIVDTNAAYIARLLTTIGLDLYYKTTVGDNEGRIAAVLGEALERSGVVITTGGLGPTVDDVTREAVAAATHRPLEVRRELIPEVEAFFRRRGARMTENNLRQARLPQGAIAVSNPVGTAPAFIVEDPRGVIISLPGVPGEMRYLMEHAVLPYLRASLGLCGVIKVRNLHTAGIGESDVDALVGDLECAANPTVGLAAHPGQTDVRVTAKAEREEEAARLVTEMEAEVRRRLGHHIYGADEETLEGVVIELLARRGRTLAVAETVTQGVLTSRLTAAAHDSEQFKGGLVAPGEVGLSGLGLPSGEDLPAEEMTALAARRVREVQGADLGLAVLARGEPGSLVAYVALDTGEAVIRHSRDLAGRPPDLILPWIANTALDAVRRALL
ncbi:MAG TPA: CinA family nicotinamide mononucleotide deamidase-related protein [Anaerolineae bacterium]|nr:CinA family nicotinamide mononucleotide deamidase-related protein [Anaerolineae bacterium]HOR00657.1 CinA family nicotinamide mononucleotide deamidase-related protein [Anaerolineae bacterium]HPL30589.1 CinA family nicotinamide mononucleotide deamidase-related protein [Anaerolineae bacterium]